MARAGSNDWVEYGERMDRVTAYVFDHLDDDLDLNKLAEVACLSPYHWHRVYHAMRRETDRGDGAAAAPASRDRVA